MTNSRFKLNDYKTLKQSVHNPTHFGGGYNYHQGTQLVSSNTLVKNSLSCYALNIQYISNSLSYKHLLDVRCKALLALSANVERGFSLQVEFPNIASGHNRVMSEYGLTVGELGNRQFYILHSVGNF
jgi:hypothetical protein